MGHEQHRGAAVAPDVEQEVLHLLAGLDVERRERLVHQQDLGAHGQRPGDRHALAHAARQLVGPLVEGLGEADSLERGAGDAPALRFRHTLQRQAEADVLPDAEPGEERRLLEDQAALGRWAGDGLAEGEEVTPGGGFEPGDQVEQRALSAAGGTQEDHELARPHGEVDVAQGLVGAGGAGRPDLGDAAA
jgi:hypothetical protein